MTGKCCMGGPASRRLARRLSAAAASILPGAALVVLPKCPLCLAAWLTVATGASFTAAGALWVRGMLVAFWVGAVALAVVMGILRKRPISGASRWMKSILDARRQVMEPDEVDMLALPVLRGFEQVDDAQEPGLTRQLWSDIRKTDRSDRIHFDFAFLHRIPATDFNAGTDPYTDAAGDLSAPDSFAKTLHEDHKKSLHEPKIVQ